MPQVFSLQHTQYHDSNVDVEFVALDKPFEVRREKDRLDREKVYRAQGVSVGEVTDEEKLEYLRQRPNLFYVDEDDRAMDDAADDYWPEHRTGPWYDVVTEIDEEVVTVDEDGEPTDDPGALKEDEAIERARELNSA